MNIFILLRLGRLHPLLLLERLVHVALQIMVRHEKCRPDGVRTAYNGM